MNLNTHLSCSVGIKWYSEAEAPQARSKNGIGMHGEMDPLLAIIKPVILLLADDQNPSVGCRAKSLFQQLRVIIMPERPVKSSCYHGSQVHQNRQIFN